MPHQCVKCSKIFKENSNEILKGCNSCGGKFFFFINIAFLIENPKFMASITFSARYSFSERPSRP